MSGDDSESDNLATRALGPAADEFSRASVGAAAVIGEATRVGAESVLVVAQAARALLAPLRLLVYGYEKFEECIVPLVAKKLAAVPEERRIMPPLVIAGPTIDAAKYTADEPLLREMFANLLVTSMDRDTAANAHPAFAEIIRQLCPDEAQILKYWAETFGVGEAWPIIDVIFRNEDGSYSIQIPNASHMGIRAGVSRPALTSAYIANLCRLGLCEIPAAVWIKGDDAYKALWEEDASIQEFKAKHAKAGVKVEFNRKAIHFTPYGRQLVNAAVVSRDATEVDRSRA